MKFGHDRKNQSANYLCNNWMRYEKNLETLDPTDVLNAKYLFAGLQKLSQEERLYLASQYRNSTGRRYANSEIAKIKGVTLEEHQETKNDILTKLQAALLELHAVFEADAYKEYEMDCFRRKVSGEG